MPINCGPKFKSIYVLKTDGVQQSNIKQNIVKHNIDNIFWQINKSLNNFVIYSENPEEIDLDLINNYEPIITNEFFGTWLIKKN